MAGFVVGKNSYEVDEQGNVYLLRGKGIKKFATDKGGYNFYNFHITKHVKVNVRAHHVVWRAFNGPIPLGMTIDHKNDVRNDNRLDNLQLLSLGDNVRKGKSRPYSLKSPEGEVFVGVNLSQLARDFNLDNGNLSNVNNGKSKSCKGWTKYEPLEDY